MWSAFLVCIVLPAVGEAVTCTVPTISIAEGVESWGGTNCASGASNVAVGTICTITPKSGFACTEPGLCLDNGNFAQSASCEVVTCTVPTISIAEGAESWGGTNCASGASNVAVGTICTITPKSGFTCTEPGLCLDNGNFAQSASCEAQARTTQAVNPQDTVIPVDDVSPFKVGMTVAISHGTVTQSEDKEIIAITTDSTGRRLAVAGKLTLNSPLQFGYPAGAMVKPKIEAPEYIVYPLESASDTASARSFCQSQGRVLAMPKTAQEQSDMYSAVSAATGNSVLMWLGGAWSSGDQAWKWDDGTKFTYTNWKQGENIDGSSETQLAMWRDTGKWASICNPCTHNFTFVCQKVVTCTVPTISIAEGAESWDGPNCASGASNVAAGTICTITPKSGFTCTEPGLCLDSGNFAQSASCKVVTCTVPTISIAEGAESWDGPNCASGASNVAVGTICIITPKSGFTCTQPGLCLDNGNFAQSASCEASSSPTPDPEVTPAPTPAPTTTPAPTWPPAPVTSITTVLSQSAMAGATTISVTDVSALKQGMRLTIADGTNSESKIIMSVHIHRRLSISRHFITSVGDQVAGSVTVRSALQYNYSAGSPITAVNLGLSFQFIKGFTRLGDDRPLWSAPNVECHWTSTRMRVIGDLEMTGVVNNTNATGWHQCMKECEQSAEATTPCVGWAFFEDQCSLSNHKFQISHIGKALTNHSYYGKLQHSCHVVPIRIGAAVTNDCCSEFSHEGRTMRTAYEAFVEWANMYRGGVLIEGHLRPLELISMGDKSDEKLVGNIAEHFVRKDVDLLLGPYSSALTEAAAKVVNASGSLLLAPGASHTRVFADRPTVFGLTGPAPLFYEPIIRTWANLGVKTVIAIQEEADFSKSACSGARESAQTLGVNFTSTLTISAGADVSEFVERNLASLQALPDALAACTYDEVCKGLLKALQHYDINFKAAAFMVCSTRESFLLETEERGRFTMGAATWMPYGKHWTDTSTWSGLSQEMLATTFAERYLVDAEPTIMAAWAAGSVLVAAMEAANSTKVSDIASAIQQLNIMTPLGKVSFDSIGQNQLPGVQFQFQARGPRPLSLDDHRPIYPMPPWSIRDCFNYRVPENLGRQLHDVARMRGLHSKDTPICGICPSKLAWWVNDAWFGSPGWLCRPSTCSLGYRDIAGRSCVPCKPGEFGNAERRCEKCERGRFTASVASTACEVCLPGHYAHHEGHSACNLCEPGKHASENSSHLCERCTPGTHAAGQGNLHCELCPKGHVTTEAGKENCTACPVGRYSAWGAAQCVDCEVGYFQDAQGKSACQACTAGTSCEQKGTVSATVSEGWWSYHPDNNEDWRWYSCAQSDFCRGGALCKEGHLDILCDACNRGYSKGAVSGHCNKCPSRARNIISLVLVAVVVSCLALKLTAWSIQAAAQSKAITSVLLKLLLNYTTTMRFMGLILKGEIRSRSLDGSNSDLLRFASMLQATALDFVSAFFSLECLVAPGLNDRDRKLVDELQSVKQPEYFAAEHAEARGILREFHEKTEVYLVLFWCLVPLVVTAAILFLSLIALGIHIRWNEIFYFKATDFFRNVKRHGWRKAVTRAAKKDEDFHEYMRAYEYRFLGIWPVLQLSDALGWDYYGLFFQESRPLFVLIFFLSYTFLMTAFVRPFSCWQPLKDAAVLDFGWRLESSVDVQCFERNFLFWFSLVCFLVYGFFVPSIGGYMLFTAGEKVHDPSFQRAVGFLVGGYEVDRNFWENLILVRKSLGELIALYGMHQSRRILLINLLAATSCLLHIWYQPFDNRYDELLDKVESLHLLCWVTFSLVLLGIHVLPENTKATPIWALLAILVVFHAIFLVFMIYHLYRHLRSQRAESLIHRAHHEQHKAMMQKELSKEGPYEAEGATQEAADGDALPERASSTELIPGGPEATGKMKWHGREYDIEMKLLPGEVLAKGHLSSWNRCVLWRYNTDLSRCPYFAMECEYGWCQLQGNMGSICAPPQDFVDLQKMESSGRKSVASMPEGVVAPSDHERITFVRLVMEAFEYVIVNNNISVFSTTLMEFIFRAALAFGSNGKPRHTYLAHNVQPTFAPEQKSTLGMPNLRKLRDSATNAITTTAQGVRDALTPKLGHSISSFTSSSSLDTPRDNSFTEKVDTELAGEDVEALQRSSTFAKTEFELGGRASTSSDDTITEETLAEVEVSHLTQMVQDMFDPLIFLRGLTLEDMQLNLNSSIMTKTPGELRVWFDLFEERCKEEWTRISERAKPPENEGSAVKSQEVAPSEKNSEEEYGVNEVGPETKTVLDPGRQLARWDWFVKGVLSKYHRRNIFEATTACIKKKKVANAASIAENLPVLEMEYQQLQEQLANVKQSESPVIVQYKRLSLEILRIRTRRAEISEETARLSAECRKHGLHSSVDALAGARQEQEGKKVMAPEASYPRASLNERAASHAKLLVLPNVPNRPQAEPSVNAF